MVSRYVSDPSTVPAKWRMKLRYGVRRLHGWPIDLDWPVLGLISAIAKPHLPSHVWH